MWARHIRERKPTRVDRPSRRDCSLRHPLPDAHVYASFADPDTPGEVCAFTGANGTRPALTSFNDWLEETHGLQPEEFWFEGKGRHRLQGWVLPRRSRARIKTPAIFYIHGGPATQYGRVFFHEFQSLAGKGTPCSTRTRAAERDTARSTMAAIFDAWGTVDYEDLMRFADEVLTAVPDRPQPDGGRGRQLRRLHDELDHRAHDAFRGGGDQPQRRQS